MAGIPFRCWRCNARNTLPKPWWEYATGAKRRCKVCGRSSLFLDKARAKRNKQYLKKYVCHCGAYHYPHRKGSGECEHGPNPYGINNPVSPDDPRLDEESRRKVLEELGEPWLLD
jgi:hypothetical protein